MTTPQVLTVFMTAPDGDVAERIASTLVEERLAACANVVREVVSALDYAHDLVPCYCTCDPGPSCGGRP